MPLYQYKWRAPLLGGSSVSTGTHNPRHSSEPTPGTSATPQPLTFYGGTPQTIPLEARRVVPRGITSTRVTHMQSQEAAVIARAPSSPGSRHRLTPRSSQRQLTKAKQEAPRVNRWSDLVAGQATMQGRRSSLQDVRFPRSDDQMQCSSTLTQFEEHKTLSDSSLASPYFSSRSEQPVLPQPMARKRSHHEFKPPPRPPRVVQTSLASLVQKGGKPPSKRKRSGPADCKQLAVPGHARKHSSKNAATMLDYFTGNSAGHGSRKVPSKEGHQKVASSKRRKKEDVVVTIAGSQETPLQATLLPNGRAEPSKTVRQLQLQGNTGQVVDLCFASEATFKKAATAVLQAHEVVCCLVMSNGSTHYRSFKKRAKAAEPSIGSIGLLDPKSGLRFSIDLKRPRSNQRTAELTSLFVQLFTGMTSKICFQVKEVLRCLLSNFELGQCVKSLQGLVDPTVAAWLLDSNKAWIDFRELLSEFLPSHHQTQGMAPVDLLDEDMTACAALMKVLEGKMQASGLTDLFHSLEMELSPILATMEQLGIGVSRSDMEHGARLLAAKVKAIEKQAHKAIGRKFLLSSTKQLREILFEELQLDTAGKVARSTNKGARSTDEASLVALKSCGHPLPGLILEYRSFQKLCSTFYDGLLVHVQNDTIHCSWLQTGTATGRLACKEPNLQNIPSHPIKIQVPGQEHENEFAPRDCFNARDGKVFLTLDFSQVELRVLAHLAREQDLISLFTDASLPDFFSALASRWLKVPLENVSHADRDKAKRVAYGLVYGMGPGLLAEQLSMTFKQAAALMKSFLKRYPGIQRFQQNCVQQCRRHGFTETLMGRRRSYAHIKSSNASLRAQAERSCVNHAIQGSAADIAKSAMIHVQQMLWESDMDCQILLQIHDEILLEVAPQDLQRAAESVARVMTSVVDLMAPLKVKAQSGTSWGQLTPMSLA